MSVKASIFIFDFFHIRRSDFSLSVGFFSHLRYQFQSFGNRKGRIGKYFQKFFLQGHNLILDLTLVKTQVFRGLAAKL